MKWIYLFLTSFITLCSYGALDAQVAIQLSHPSVEDTPAPSTKPTGWADCGFESETPPDIQPCGAFNVTTRASNGNTYIGLVTRDNETWEGIAQRLVSPIEAGVCYKFSLDLARSESYRSLSRSTNMLTDFVQPVKVRIWGGTSYCDRLELLAESDIIESTQWKNHQLQFTSNENYRYFFLEAYYKTPSLFPYNGNVLVDNCSKLVPCHKKEEKAPIMIDEPVAIVESNTSEEKASSKINTPTTKDPVQIKASEPYQEETIVEVQDPDSEPKIDYPENQPKLIYNPDLDIKNLKEGQIVKLNKLYFAANSFEIKEESYPVLDEIVAFLATNINVKIELGGHTNGLPPHSFCDELSRNRAFRVRQYFIKKGIVGERIVGKGYGKRKPIASNSTKQGREANQRVEVKILSLKG